MIIDYPNLRSHMVKDQIAARGISDPATLKSMGMIPREKFVPETLMPHAYDDSPLPIGEGQTISQPFIVALMTASLALKPEQTVLEIGTGSGYQAAVLSQIVKKVYTVERIPVLAERSAALFKELGFNNIEVKLDDGTMGWAEHAPYDSIIVTAGAPEVPKSLKAQLKIGGKLVIPVGKSENQRLIILDKLGEDDWKKRVLEFVRFVPLIGEEGW